MRLLGRRVHLRDAKAAALIVAGKVDETTAVALLGFTLAPHPFLSIILTVLLKTLPAFLPGLALFLWGQSSRPAFLLGYRRRLLTRQPGRHWLPSWPRGRLPESSFF